MFNTLLISTGGNVIDVIGWTKAIYLTYFKRSDAVYALEWHDYEVRSPSTSLKLPSVLLLVSKNGAKYHNQHSRLNLTRKNIFVRDNNTCQWCGKHVTTNTGTVDHVYPLSKGGTNTWRNVVASCKDCNTLKGDMTAEEANRRYGMKLINKPYVPMRNILFVSYLGQKAYEKWEPYLQRCVN